MDVWDVLDHPVLISVGLFVLAIVGSLLWAALRLALARAKGGPASGIDIGAIVSAWRQRPKTSDVVDVGQLQAMIQEAFVAGHGVDVAGETKESRIANLEALHAEGRITAEKLVELKAAIQAEG
ncbi:hypothetical protein [Aeromicrobium ginsengisoli]|uniref:SHOCT domain-containing protein n=1 Tax=Aeromicrobium ginsengisoli TaxID=363867 RepID=A0A5M4FDS0_9ACTN|nr:hypothetical protein [Aeromicrobium ginsengisoli]KAA1397485.1 hypothetical protein ESP70_008905 [Aeromicrobium ginsengisoli]